MTTDEVEAIANSIGKEQTIGNVLIWFLCALGFLKLSTKMESIIGALGINVGNSGGGSILGAAMVAMRGLKTISGGGHGHSNSGSTSSTISGSTSPLSGGLAGVIGRKISSNAADSITGKIDSSFGESMFDKSLAEGSDFSKDIISSIAQGEINGSGSISGERASAALSAYMGHGDGSSLNSSSTASHTSNSSIESSSSGLSEVGQSNFSTEVAGNDMVDSFSTSTSTDIEAPTIGESPFVDSIPDSLPDYLESPSEQSLISSSSDSPENSSLNMGLQIGSAPFTDVQVPPSDNAVDSNTANTQVVSGNSIPSKQEIGSASSTHLSNTSLSGTTHISSEAKSKNSASATSESVNKITQSASTSMSKNESLSAGPTTAENNMAYGGNPSISIGNSPFADNTSLSQQGPLNNIQTPEFRDVEIGGGRITGKEITSDNPDGIKFGMYHAEKYMEPSGKHDVVSMIDGSKWYKQYAVDIVDKSPTQGENGKIGYEEKIVKQLPPVPKRKDRI